MKKIIHCQFNIDNCRVELTFSDGSMIVNVNEKVSQAVMKF